MTNIVICPEIETKLRVTVERAVRPVAAMHLRQRRMREELFAHLVSTFEQELNTTVNEEEALSRAVARFGAPAELTEQLQASVPRWSAWLSRLQYVPRPFDFTPFGVLRAMLLFSLVIYGIILPLPYVLQWLHVGRGVPGGYFYYMSVMAFTTLIFAVPFHCVSFQLGRMSLDKTLGWNPRSLWLLLAAAIYLPLWFTALYCGLSGELASGLTMLLPTYLVGPVLGPVVAVLQGRKYQDDVAFLRNWNWLQLEA